MRIEKPPNDRSDVSAKLAFCEKLRSEGFANIAISGSPVDVLAERNGVRWQYEIKFTRAREQQRYFGAATLTEWRAAAKDPEHFRFVVAYVRNDSWRFDLYSPEQFMAYSYVPPFKIFFSVPLDDAEFAPPAALSRRIKLTKERLKMLTQQFEDLGRLEK